MADSVQQEVIKLISSASAELGAAHKVAVKKNPMAQDLPVFLKLQAIQKDLGEAMREVSKVRGL